MLKRNLTIILLLTGALSVQLAISAEQEKLGTADNVRPVGAASASKTAHQSELGGVF